MREVDAVKRRRETSLEMRMELDARETTGSLLQFGACLPFAVPS